SKESLPWQHLRNGEVRRYDLRALVEGLWLLEHRDGMIVLGMRLRADSLGSGRAEQVTAALGFAQPPRAIHRTQLLLAQAQ
ncbi:MAG: hypothetical protein Q8O76_02375, partial [Chloroflexota bacterium]|nr:hypothetical protein [Chloroflexota bacterium]